MLVAQTVATTLTPRRRSERSLPMAVADHSIVQQHEDQQAGMLAA